MRRLLICLILLSLVMPTLPACGGRTAPPPAAAAVLEAMQAAMRDSAQTLPDGLIYTRAAEAGDPAHLSDTLFSALFGEAARGLLGGDAKGDAEGTEGAEAAEGAPPIGDAAIFLSVAPYPCELAVLRCSDTRSILSVAGLCRGRLDTVARAYAGGEWADVAARGVVAVEGSFVLLVISEDPEAVLAGARRAIS